MEWSIFFEVLDMQPWWVKVLVVALFSLLCMTTIQWIILPWKINSISDSLKQIANKPNKTNS